MSIKVILYFLSTALVIWSLDAVDINKIFKKYRVWQARVFYFIITVSLVYLFTNFIYDFFISSKF